MFIGISPAETAEHFRIGTVPNCSQEDRLVAARAIVRVGVEFVQVLKAYDVGYAYCAAASEILGKQPIPNLSHAIQLLPNNLGFSFSAMVVWAAPRPLFIPDSRGFN